MNKDRHREVSISVHCLKRYKVVLNKSKNLFCIFKKYKTRNFYRIYQKSDIYNNFVKLPTTHQIHGCIFTNVMNSAFKACLDFLQSKALAGLAKKGSDGTLCRVIEICNFACAISVVARVFSAGRESILGDKPCQIAALADANLELLVSQ